MPLDDFFAHEEMSLFQKKLVHSVLNHEGLSLLEYEHMLGKKKHVEVYG